MKKSILLLGLLVGGLSFTSQAQKTNDDFSNPHFKAEERSFTAEMGLAGGINNADFKLNEGAQGLLRFRYFLKDDLALRLGFSLTADHDRENFYDIATSNHGKKVQNETSILLNLGVEKHFDGTSRLSPYIGADLLMGVNVERESLSNTDGLSYIFGRSSSTKGPGFYEIGLRAVVGADYYFAKHVYLGAELGMGGTFRFDGSTKLKTTIGGTTTYQTLKSEGNSMHIGPSIITGVRLGFVF